MMCNLEKLAIFLSLLMITIQITGETVLTSENTDQMNSNTSNEVVIGGAGIKMPLGKILLARRNSEYCTIKFTKFWTKNQSEKGSIFVASGSDKYANYESYYQGDSTGDFSKENVQIRKDELSFPKPRGIGRFAFSIGNKNIRCGPIKLLWFGEGWVNYYSEGQMQGDYGIEMAPTKWTDISEVNVFDPRLKWYRYNPKLQNYINIPIDQLWEDTNNKQ